MRLTTAIWFGVFMRNESARGAFVSVIKSGAQQAGAIFIVNNHLDGSFTLYSPAPQSFFNDNLEDDRLFEIALKSVDQQRVDEYLQKQIKFDPDLWIIETESGNGELSLQLAQTED